MALPDYPSLKRDISNALLLTMNAALQQHMGPFNAASHSTHYEGDVTDFSTVDGEVRELEFKTISIEDRPSMSDLPKMTHQQILQAMSEYGTQFGQQTAQGFIDELDKTLNASGRVINAQGRPLDAELLLEIYDSIEISFDDRGRPNLPDLISGNPGHRETIRRIFTEDVEFITKSVILTMI